MLDQEDTHLENVRERIQRNGPGAEMLRQAYIERLRSHIEAFYEHGSLADLISLCAAFDALEGDECCADGLHRARLVEKLTALIGESQSWQAGETITGGYRSCRRDLA